MGKLIVAVVIFALLWQITMVIYVATALTLLWLLLVTMVMSIAWVPSLLYSDINVTMASTVTYGNMSVTMAYVVTMVMFAIIK